MVDQQIEDGLLPIPVRDAERSVVVAAAGHVDEGQIVDAVLRRESPSSLGTIDCSTMP